MENSPAGLYSAFQSENLKIHKQWLSSLKNKEEKKEENKRGNMGHIKHASKA